MAKYDWYNELSQVFMGRGYFHNNETIQDRVEAIANLVGDTFKDEDIRFKVKDYIERGFYVLPTPVWSNVGTGRGSGISCFNTHVADTVEEIVRGNAEIGMLCKIGGGTSSYWGDVRPAGAPISTGGESHGVTHFLEMFSATKNTISQGSTRRGEHAAYLPIEHKDIEAFLKINGEGANLQRLPIGVTVKDQWLTEMKEGDMEKRRIWAMVLDARGKTGFPYIFFHDNVNKGTADVYKDKNMTIYSSNMCTECLLPSSEEESFVCDIVGMNLVTRDEWKDTDAIRIAVYIADAVLEEFINQYENTKFIERAVRFAKNHRAIGIGTSGYHSYLQSKMIPFESMAAKSLNVQIYKDLQAKCIAASEEMAERYGKPEVLKEDKYKRRHTCLNFIAPNTSSSFIVGQQSQSIEPYVSNYYLKKAAKVLHPVKNPYLEKLLEEKGHNTLEVWEDILKNDGSVQHLTILSDDEKLVFRTFMEISQMEIVIQAATRQKFLDQGQSLNLMIHPATPVKDINTLVLKAHELGIKTLYYKLGKNSAQEFARSILVCEACGG